MFGTQLGNLNIFRRGERLRLYAKQDGPDTLTVFFEA